VTYSSIRERLGGSIHRARDPTVTACASHQLARDEQAEHERRYGGLARRDPQVEDEAYTRVACEHEKEARGEEDAGTTCVDDAAPDGGRAVYAHWITGWVRGMDVKQNTDCSRLDRRC
jgi:hypothetical protein